MRKSQLVAGMNVYFIQGDKVYVGNYIESTADNAVYITYIENSQKKLKLLSYVDVYKSYQAGKNALARRTTS